MSTTYSIGCTQCKKHLWIAQSSQDSKTLYAGQDGNPALKDFLFEHIKHNLVFIWNGDEQLEEWDEIEIKQPSTNLLNPQAEWVRGDRPPIKAPNTIRCCLITADFGDGPDVAPAFFSQESDCWIFNGYPRDDVKVIAWMDQPKPYCVQQSPKA